MKLPLVNWNSPLNIAVNQEGLSCFAVDVDIIINQRADFVLNVGRNRQLKIL